MSDNLETTLIKVNKFINIDKNREKYTSHYNALRNKVFDLLQQHDLFKTLFNGHSLQGSYGDNLKVNMPDEFDSVFMLKLPEFKRAKIEKDNQIAGNVRINLTDLFEKIKNEVQHSGILKLLKKWVDGKNYLMVEKIQSWLKSCFDKVLTTMEYKITANGCNAMLKYSRQGPAHTLYVIGNGDFKYSVDFVPGLIFSSEQNVIKGMKGNWLAIPKPLKPAQPNSISFRSSFFNQESEIIKDKKNLKNVLRMMKKFRDTHKNLNNLKSYYIKTLFLMKAKDNNNSYWESPLSKIVVDMFHDLEKTLYEKNLPFFWDKKCNMYAHYTDKQMEEMRKCVTNHKSTLLSGKSAMDSTILFKIYKLFLTNEERKIENITNPNSCNNISNEIEENFVFLERANAEKQNSKSQCCIG